MLAGKFVFKAWRYIQRADVNRMPEGGFPHHFSAVFVFKLFIKLVVPYHGAQCIDASATAGCNNLISYLDIVKEVRKLIERLC